MPSRKCRVRSVSGRHYDARWRKAPGIFQKASKAFYNFRSLPSSHGNCRSTCLHRTKFFSSALYPFYLNAKTKRSLCSMNHKNCHIRVRVKTANCLFRKKAPFRRWRHICMFAVSTLSRICVKNWVPPYLKFIILFVPNQLISKRY